MAGSAQAGYNDLAEKVDPRLAGLVSWKNADETFGVLVSAAYSQRRVVEQGHATVGWAPTGTSGGFNPASTLPGYTIGQINLLPVSNGSNWDSLIYQPRIPRFTNWQYDMKRLGLTGSAQWRPSDTTLLTVDGLYSQSKTQRNEDYLEAVFILPTATGKPETIIRDGMVNEKNSLVYGVFDNVDLFVESRRDRYQTKFQQYNATLEQEFSDRFHATLFGGYAKSVFEVPVQTTITLNTDNVDGYSWDYRDNDRSPAINLGFDPSNPANWKVVNGQSAITIARQDVSNSYRTLKLNGQWEVADGLKFSFGGEYRRFKYSSQSFGRRVSDQQSITLTPDQIAANTTIRNGLTGDPKYGSFVIPDFDKFAETFNIYCNCVQTINGQNVDLRIGGLENPNTRSAWVDVTETEKAAFFQAQFNVPLGDMTLRGDAGIRYVATNQVTVGYTASNASIERLVVDRDYDHWLPSLNLALDVTPKLIFRFSTAKAISRPGLGALSPGGAFMARVQGRSFSTGNPFLDPTAATNIDLSAELYFARGSLLSIGLFQKKISTLSGTAVTDEVPFTALGLPLSLLDGTGVLPTDLFVYSRTVNGEGGTLKGLEINYQHQLRFLPSFLSNLGVLANYTYVKANITYPGPGGSAPLVGPLTNLSKESANATLFYEDKSLSIRGSVAYRSGYITAFGGGVSDSATERGVNSTLNFDASASYKITDNITLTLEALNLTNEPQDQYVDEDNRVLTHHQTGRQVYAGVRVRF